jgi:hypothetical protein
MLYLYIVGMTGISEITEAPYPILIFAYSKKVDGHFLTPLISIILNK